MATHATIPHPDTERVNERSTGIDTLPSGDVLRTLWEDQMHGVGAVEQAIPDIEAAALAVADELADPDSGLTYAGAGSSGVLAGLDGIELPCTFGWPDERLAVCRADDSDNVLRIATPGDDAIEAANHDFERSGVRNGDVVVTVSASGSTPYTCRFAQLAKEAGALVVGIAHNKTARLLQLADYPIFLNTGPEVVAGSTRLKAGTAQKAALGMFSTLVMIRLGHVYDGLMVSMVPGNEKLRRRAARIVAHIAEVTEEAARAALQESGDRIKVAALIAKGLTPKQAESVLCECGQNLRDSLLRIAEA